MAANVEQELIEKLRTLPAEQQQKVLHFVEDLQHSHTSPETETGPAKMTIWDKVKDIIEQIPAEAWEELPKDGSLNVDHYLYGSPKREK
jgi:hypothetical protein